MASHGVVVLPYNASHLLKIVVEVNISGQPSIIKLCLRVCMGMLPVKHIVPTNLFVSDKCHRDHQTHKVEVNLATLSFFGYYHF